MKKVKTFYLVAPLKTFVDIDYFSTKHQDLERLELILESSYMLIDMQLLPCGENRYEYVSNCFYPYLNSNFLTSVKVSSKEEIIVDTLMKSPEVLLLEFVKPKMLSKFVKNDCGGLRHIAMSFKDVRELEESVKLMLNANKWQLGVIDWDMVKGKSAELDKAVERDRKRKGFLDSGTVVYIVNTFKKQLIQKL